MNRLILAVLLAATWAGVLTGCRAEGEIDTDGRVSAPTELPAQASL